MIQVTWRIVTIRVYFSVFSSYPLNNCFDFSQNWIPSKAGLDLVSKKLSINLDWSKFLHSDQDNFSNQLDLKSDSIII